MRNDKLTALELERTPKWVFSNRISIIHLIQNLAQQQRTEALDQLKQVLQQHVGKPID